MSSTPKRMARIAVAAALAALLPLTVSGQQAGYPGGAQYPFGTPATKAEIEAWDKDVRPDGMGLPAGLDEPNHGHHRAEEPAPADQELGFLPHQQQGGSRQGQENEEGGKNGPEFQLTVEIKGIKNRQFGRMKKHHEVSFIR